MGYFVRTAWLIANVCLGVNAFAKVVTGKVVAVREGDRIVVQDARKQKHMIALLGIEAPQKKQTFFFTSVHALTKKLMGHRVSVEWWRYLGRCRAPRKSCLKLGKVLADDEDVNLWMVAKGLAWHDTRFLAEQSTPDRSLYRDTEERAREKRLGLWKSRAPVAPWKFVEN